MLESSPLKSGILVRRLAVCLVHGRFNVAGVILVTPFANVKRLFQERVGPLAAFVEEWFDNSEAIKEAPLSCATDLPSTEGGGL